jgi:hypothetical protein
MGFVRSKNSVFSSLFSFGVISYVSFLYWRAQRTWFMPSPYKSYSLQTYVVPLTKPLETSHSRLNLAFRNVPILRISNHGGTICTSIFRAKCCLQYSDCDSIFKNYLRNPTNLHF